MSKILTLDECLALKARLKESEINNRTTEFNGLVNEVVELVRTTFIGQSCVVPLKKVIRTHTMDGDPATITFVERNKEVINAAVDILREEFRASGWNAFISPKTPIWPFTTKIVVELSSMQYAPRCPPPGSRPPKK